MAVYKFYADWCGPCKILEKNISVAKIQQQVVPVNIELPESKELIVKYGITGIPALVKEDGTKMVGVKTVKQIEEFING
jgi:thiol-disulfide isomerase/thioredoxin